MTDLDELARDYVQALPVGPAPDLTDRITSLRRRRRVRAAALGCAAALLVVGGLATLPREADPAETVRAVSDETSRGSSGPPAAWQLDAAALPRGWTAELVGVNLFGGHDDESAMVRYALTRAGDVANLLIVPGSFDLDPSRIVSLDRDGRTLDVDVDSVGDGVTVQWNEGVEVGVSLSATSPAIDVLELASALRFEHDPVVGVTTPQSNDGIIGSSPGEIVDGGEVDGLPWRWWIATDGLQAALELDGVVADGGTFDSMSIGSMHGRAEASLVTSDGTTLVLIVSDGSRDAMSVVYDDGRRKALPTVSAADGRLTWAAFPIERDAGVSVIDVGESDQPPDLTIELPAVPSTGWVTGQASSTMAHREGPED